MNDQITSELRLPSVPNRNFEPVSIQVAIASSPVPSIWTISAGEPQNITRRFMAAIVTSLGKRPFVFPCIRHV